MNDMPKFLLKRTALVLVALCTLFGSLNAGPRPGGAPAATGYLFVGYGDPQDGQIPGVVVYTVRRDGSLSGIWTYGEAGGRVMTETAVRNGDGNGIEGNFATSGSNPNGQEYKGQMSIRKIGEKVYSLNWSNGDRGTGILAGDTLVVGYGANSGVVVYILQSDGSAEGFWTTAADEGRVGTETFGPSDLTGDHATRGTRPDGGDYSGQLVIQSVSKSTGVYRLKWDSGHQGVGIYVRSK
jgi:hypothetical protein